MSVLLYCNDPKEHAKFLETMMRFKKNVCLDLLAVMAYGPAEVLQPAVQLLFHYYPSIDVGEFHTQSKALILPKTYPWYGLMSELYVSISGTIAFTHLAAKIDA